MCMRVPAMCVLIVPLERCLGVSRGIFWPSLRKWGRICSFGLFRRAPFPQCSYQVHDTQVESPWLSVSVHREPVFSPPVFISWVLADYPSPCSHVSPVSPALQSQGQNSIAAFPPGCATILPHTFVFPPLLPERAWVYRCLSSIDSSPSANPAPVFPGWNLTCDLIHQPQTSLPILILPPSCHAPHTPQLPEALLF